MPKTKLTMENLKSVITQSKHPLNFQTLVRIFSARGSQKRILKQYIKELKDSRQIVKQRNRRYSTYNDRNIERVSGTIDLSKYGYAFLIPDNPSKEDIFIPQKHLFDAFHKDKVVVEITQRNYRGKPEGKVKEIIERGLGNIIGRYNEHKGKKYVIPIDDRVPMRISLKDVPGELDLKHGDICATRVDWGTYRKGQISADVVDNFQNLQNPDNDATFVMLKHNVTNDRNPSLEKEAKDLTGPLIDINDRENLTTKGFITIDPKDAKDFDDAIFLEKVGDGWIAWVSIADVSAFVKPSSSIDLEARKRANSFYFPGFVVPMLPEEISTGLCSLNENGEKLCLTIRMELSKNLSIRDFNISESLIRSALRTNYDSVYELVKGNDLDFSSENKSLLLLMYAFSQKLFEKRMSQGGIDFNLPEAKYVYDETGKITDILRAYRNPANQIVEEFMLLANRCVCEFIHSKNLPQIYRVHEEPDVSKLKDFYERAREFGFTRISRNIKSAKELNSFLNGIKSSSAERSLRYLLLRSMKQAKYSTENRGHYGLGFDYYAHFTSPIRRYPDLITHRIVKGLIARRKNKDAPERFEREELDAIAQQASKQERIAMECERDILKIKSARFMQNKIGTIFVGYVSGKSKGGFFIELKDHMVEGFCPMHNVLQRRIPRKRFTKGKREPFKYSIGDQVRVKLKNVVIEELLIEFEFC